MKRVKRISDHDILQLTAVACKCKYPCYSSTCKAAVTAAYTWLCIATYGLNIRKDMATLIASHVLTRNGWSSLPITVRDVWQYIHVNDNSSSYTGISIFSIYEDIEDTFDANNRELVVQITQNHLSLLSSQGYVYSTVSDDWWKCVNRMGVTHYD